MSHEEIWNNWTVKERESFLIRRSYPFPDIEDKLGSWDSLPQWFKNHLCIVYPELILKEA